VKRGFRNKAPRSRVRFAKPRVSEETAGLPKDAMSYTVPSGRPNLPETLVMKGSFHKPAALAALLLVGCGREGGITGPNDRDALLHDRTVLAIGVDSTTGASIETNKDDYLPGEVVHLVGRGWAAGETVSLHMTEEPNTHADVDTNVVVDASGEFDIHFYDVQSHDLGVTFTLTATGQTSGSRAVAVLLMAAKSAAQPSTRSPR
jgi:hypothetical protein